MVRLIDIARRANTSVSTVSIVLGNRRYVAISDTTRQAVLSAARELGYAPNMAARRLRRNGAQQRTIVLAIAHPIDGRLSLISRIVAGVQGQLHIMRDKLQMNDSTVQLIVETYELGQLGRLRGLTEPYWFNGLLITNTSPEDDAYIEHLTPSIPIVLFQRASRHSAVMTDGAYVGRLATQHLIDLGHRRIGLLYPDTASQAQEQRMQGYRDALQKAGLPLGPEAVALGRNWAGGAYIATQQLLNSIVDERPTAIFATNDLLALGAMRAVRDWGLRIPEHIAMVGCDDAEFAAYHEPPLTTVYLPIEDMAARATVLLLDMIQQRVQEPIHEMFPAHLIIRRSSGSPRSSSEPDVEWYGVLNR